MEKNQNQQTHASQVSAEDRLKTSAIATASNLKLHASGGSGGKDHSEVVPVETVENLISDWPAMPKSAAQSTIKAYGPPNEAAPSRLTWYNNGPWKRTIVIRDEIPHDFPDPHSDCIEQVINYQVPVEKFSEIAKFDGSVIIERTRGEVSARCDMEGANILALNMVHEIATGNKTAEEARQLYTEQTAAYVMNESAPYAEQFQFPVSSEEKFDTDTATIQSEALSAAIEKVKGKLGLDENK